MVLRVPVKVNVELILVSEKPPDIVPKYMSACDVLILASDGEGSPMVIKEAMACNLPIVSVRVGDVPEVIGNTKGCFLCSQEPQDIAEKLERALDWGKRTNGREKINHLEISTSSRKVIDVYKKVLKEKKGLYLKLNNPT